MCPPEFMPFQETLEKFFQKNFREEIRRLGLDRMSDQMTVSGTSKSPYNSTQYQSSIYELSLKQSTSNSSANRAPFIIPPLQLGQGGLGSAPLSPRSTISPTETTSKQTPLQRHLAHLARHGITGVSSAPGENGGSESLSAESPHDSFMNVNNGMQAVPVAQRSGASMTTSTLGGSLSSLKGRFSRLGSLNFGRKNGSSS